jgi:hypothetical protein
MSDFTHLRTNLIKFAEQAGGNVRLPNVYDPVLDCLQEEVDHGQHHLPCRSRRGRHVHPQRPRIALKLLGGDTVSQVEMPVASKLDGAGLSFVEWGAVLAGAVLAAALSFVLLTFGTAIGLSATSPWPNSGLSAKVIASLAVFWVMAQQIGSVMAGGYIAGRMRSRWHEAGYEAEFRDGLHGGLVWAVAVLISALLVFATAGVAARTGTDIGGKAVGLLSNPTDRMDAVLDTMLRSTTTAQAPNPSAPASPATTATRPGAGNTSNWDETRAEMSRVIASSIVNGSITNENRTYLAQLVAQRTGVAQQEAERRVDDAVTAVRAAADKARHAAILTGFVTAAALILSLAAGWWAAVRGGHHREASVPARFTFGDRRRTRLT